VSVPWTLLLLSRNSGDHNLRLVNWEYSVCSELFPRRVREGTPFLPKSHEEIQVPLNISMLEKVIYELGYEMNNRPDWIKIPLEVILQLLEDFRGENG
jgi:hypothetical protein